MGDWYSEGKILYILILYTIGWSNKVLQSCSALEHELEKNISWAINFLATGIDLTITFSGVNAKSNGKSNGKRCLSEHFFSKLLIKPSFLRHAYMFKLDLPDVSVLKNKKIWVWDKVNNLLCKDWDYEKLLYSSLWSILLLSSSLTHSLSITPVEPSRSVFLRQGLVVRVLRSCIKDSFPAINNLEITSSNFTLVYFNAKLLTNL